MKTNDNHYNLLNIEINSKIELSKENITSYKQMMNIISKNDTVSQYIKIWINFVFVKKKERKIMK